jgi:hypothetical protein
VGDIAVALQDDGLACKQGSASDADTGRHHRAQLIAGQIVDRFGADCVGLLINQPNGAVVRADQLTRRTQNARKQRLQVRLGADGLDVTQQRIERCCELVGNDGFSGLTMLRAERMNARIAPR